MSKKTISDLAILGGKPAFSDPLFVNKPSIGNRRAFQQRLDAMFASHWFTNDGPLVQELESRLCNFLGTRHCILTVNGTNALQLCIRAMGLSGEVIVPSFTFIATAHALMWEGVKPVFCDIDPSTKTIDPEACEALITDRTTAILGVHVFGRACDTRRLESVATRHGLCVLYDAAHAFGCSHDGQLIGSFGSAEVFSFHATKCFHTFEGGAVTTNSNQLASQIRLTRNFGFSDYDTVSTLGINGKMTEVCAAMGLANLDAFGKTVEKNRLVYETYMKRLMNVAGISMLAYDSQKTANYYYVVIEVDEVEFGFTRDELMTILLKENVVARRYFYPGCHRMKPYSDLRTEGVERLRTTERIADHVLVLPTGAEMGVDQAREVCGIIDIASTEARAIRTAFTARGMGPVIGSEST